MGRKPSCCRKMAQKAWGGKEGPGQLGMAGALVGSSPCLWFHLQQSDGSHCRDTRAAQAWGAFNPYLAPQCMGFEKPFWEAELVGWGAVWGDSWGFTLLSAAASAEVSWKLSPGWVACSGMALLCLAPPHPMPYGVQCRRQGAARAPQALQPGLHGGLGTVFEPAW